MLEWIVSSSVLILVVFILRGLLKGKLSARLRYALWAAALVRLLVPVSLTVALPASAASLVPELPQAWEERVVPILPQGRQAAEDNPFAASGALEPGQTVSTETSMGYYHRSGDGDTVTRYLDLWSPVQILRAVWLAGAVLLGTVLLWSNLRFWARLKKRRSPLEVPEAPLPVYMAEGLPSPCLFGVIRPAVYLTPEAAELPQPQRGHILAHELTHSAHGDQVWALLRCLCLALHWYNPLVWLAAVLSKRDGELACDEGAVRRLGEDQRIPYGRTLVDLVARRGPSPRDLLSCSTAMTEGEKGIQERIALLVKGPRTVRTALFAAVSVLALAVVFTFARGSGRQTETDWYGAFRYQVGSAQAVQLSLPPDSSQWLTDSILDADLLEQARELLGQARDLMTPAEGLDQSTIAFVSYRLDLVQPGREGEEEHSYLLYYQDSVTYVVAPPEVGAEEYTPVAVLSFNLPAALENLVREQRERSQGGTPLTEGELACFNGEFFNGESFNIRNQFLTSLYSAPEDIDLYELFYCGDGQPGGRAMSQEEVRAVLDAGYGGQEPDCACTKITRAGMDQVLLDHMGLTLDQTSGAGLEGFTYLPEYDAYYVYHGDTNYNGNAYFYSGLRRGDRVVLYGSGDTSGGEGTILTLREEKGNYYFLSNQKAPDRGEGGLAERLRGLNAGEIREISGGANSGGADAQSLAQAVRRAAEQPLPRPEDESAFLRYDLWGLSFTLSDGSALDLSAGQAEDVVRIGDGYFRSPELYRVIRDCWTPPEGAVVQDDLGPVQGTVDELLSDELAFWRGEAAKDGSTERGAPYTGVELTEFRLLYSFPELVKGTQVKLYAVDYGLSIENLSQADWAGGPYADGNGLFHPYSSRYHLMTVEREGRVEGCRAFLWDFRLEEGRGIDIVDRDYVQDVMVNELRDLLDPVVSADITDPQQAAEEYGKALARYYLSLGPGHPQAVTDAQLAGAEIYQQSGDALCATITLAVDPVGDPTQNVYWAAGAGVDYQDAGPWAGRWLYSLEYRLERQGDGSWRCTDRGTGGVSLPEYG